MMISRLYRAGVGASSLITLVVVLVSLLRVEPLPVPPADEPQSEQAGQPVASLHASSVHDLGGGVSAEVNVFLSDLAFDAKGDPIRVIMSQATCTVGRVLLWQSSAMVKQFAWADDAIVTSLGPITPGLAKALAAELLFDESDANVLQQYVESEQQVPKATLSVLPKNGHTWGTVLSADDLDFAVAPAESH